MSFINNILQNPLVNAFCRNGDAISTIQNPIMAMIQSKGTAKLSASIILNGPPTLELPSGQIVQLKWKFDIWAFLTRGVIQITTPPPVIVPV